jgi:hypothetical protein
VGSFSVRPARLSEKRAGQKDRSASSDFGRKNHEGTV